MSTLRHEETMEQYYARIQDAKNGAKYTLSLHIENLEHYVACIHMLCDVVSRDRKDWGFTTLPHSILEPGNSAEVLIFKDMGNFDPQAFSEKLSALGTEKA